MSNPIKDKIVVTLKKQLGLIVTTDFVHFGETGVFLTDPVRQYKVQQDQELRAFPGTPPGDLFVPYHNVLAVSGFNSNNSSGDWK